MSVLTLQEDAWYKSAKTPDDRSPESFFMAFKLTNRFTAHRRYGWVIRRCCSDMNLRNERQDAFEQWKLSDRAELYWTHQKARLSAIRTAGTLIEASESYAEDSLHRISIVPKVTSTTPIGSPTRTMQSEPLRVEDLDLPPPALTSPADVSTTLDASDAEGTVPDPAPTISGEDDESPLIAMTEREFLLSQIESIGHECEPQGGVGCLTCQFKSYQRLCATALHQNELQITDVADVVALLGVLVPSKATERMKSIFQEKTLDDLRRSDEEWPNVGFNESLVTDAIRHCMRGQKGRVSEVLRPLGENYRRIQLLLETRLEYLPLEEVKELSEMDFTVKYVGPVMEAFLDSNRAASRFPNKNCLTQKRLGMKPDRPDLSVVVGKTEVAFGEITGPSKQKSTWKNNWDFYRTVRYGKAFLDAGHKIAPLFQIIYTKGTYMRLKEATHGMFVLEEVGAFTIPVTVEMIALFMANIQTLVIAQADIERIAVGSLEELKRSWGYKDLGKNKKSLVQGSKGRKAVRRSQPEGADGTLERGQAPPTN
ncbi:hypothetical protein EMPS_06653 [Entomortierella parvispora]|uniref:Uncharacterized protein n=1 Tax=Entomortierella parvispora TaxID=205924 RepID=A0A9P3HCQ8_9FUNG|nr:hypothetical protein EMPS_06653 [Entomortierella parvispora]